ncbi:unnamed protein product [Auanema sp. JU1783]|nr:unnamed protein product [Auanema sp. JU1783]
MKIENPKDKILFSISEILPHLYLAGYGCITESKLRNFGITHAVDATNLSNKQIPAIEYLKVNVDDDVISKISNHFEDVCNFIDKAKSQGGKVIVFCAAGVSRSATLVLIYLLQCEGKTLKDAYYMVNQVRPIISPNLGFWRQMIEFEKEKKGESTVTLLSGRTARPVPDVYLHRALNYNTQKA